MLLLWLLHLRRPNLNGWLVVVAGVLSGALVMMRPSTLLLMPFVAIWFVITTSSRRRAIAYIALFLMLVALPIGMWTLRNWVTFGEFIPLATNGGVTFWEGNHPLGNGGVIEPSAETWLGPNPPAGIEGWSGLSEKESETRFYDAAFRWIRDNPLPFLRLLPLKLYRGLSLAFGNEARASAIPAWLSAGYFFVLLMALSGIVLSWKHRHALLLCYGVLFEVFGTMLVFYGSSRQSALAVPVLMMFLAYSLENILRRLHGLRKSFFVAKPSLEA
jgi:hypothetical protein